MGATLLLMLVMLSAWRLEAQREELEDVEALDWWQRGVFYQIYPRSFQDSNGDGVGDLPGIGSRLDYLKTLGITGVWLSPIYQSPQADFGYDISDFRKIDPVYGSLADFARLRDGVHERGLKLILDFVPNHTSDEHEWFQKALQNDPRYADYYVWHKGKLLENGTRTYPNNWLSFFDGPAWTWSEQRQMYYLRQYHPKQPDLNYRNPAVLQEMLDVMKFWLNAGVDGFRVDSVNTLVEDDRFLDEPRSFLPGARPGSIFYHNHIFTQNQPETYEIIRKFRAFLDDYARSEAEGRACAPKTNCARSVTVCNAQRDECSSRSTSACYEKSEACITQVSVCDTKRTECVKLGVVGCDVERRNCSQGEGPCRAQRQRCAERIVEACNSERDSCGAQSTTACDAQRQSCVAESMEACNGERQSCGLEVAGCAAQVEECSSAHDGSPRRPSTKAMLTEAYTDMKHTVQYYGNSTHPGAHFAFNFFLLTELSRESQAQDFQGVIEAWMTTMPAGKWANWVVGNHDNPRIATRFGAEVVDAVHMIQFTLPGTTVTYAGDELGMEDAFIRWDESVDPFALNVGREHYLDVSRDGCRAPFLWDSSVSAGFSSNPRTWLPVNPNYYRANLQRQTKNERSHYWIYRNLLQLKDHPVIQFGSLNVKSTRKILVIERADKSRNTVFVTVFNTGSFQENLHLSQVLNLPTKQLSVYASSSNSERTVGVEVDASRIHLRPKEALVLTNDHPLVQKGAIGNDRMLSGVGKQILHLPLKMLLFILIVGLI
nr:PREDICTED: maltase 2-like [Bemisia tabaci]